MGLKFFSDPPSANSYGTVDGHSNLHVAPPYQDGNPNKYRYNILKTETIGQVIVVEIHYPDCFSWSGRKICVYDNVHKFQNLHSKGCIDPHFLESEYSPFARFEPTQRGWNLAVKLAETLNDELKNQ
ncbi:MAG: hypothetical protein HXY23_14055 [Parvularculaceae bacterium]|nr:hypothetical protein [Parvularculaceae bacterium]